MSSLKDRNEKGTGCNRGAERISKRISSKHKHSRIGNSCGGVVFGNSSSRSTVEQNDKNVRPEIGSEDLSLDGYKIIYLGFPIWWGEEPRILDTFVEKYSFEGITVIPFCTSGGSGIGRSGPNMEALAGNGTWLEGERFSGSVSEEELKSWIDGLK